MNKDSAIGTWEVTKGKAKMMWAELTDDDFLKAEGSMDKLVGRIHERFGEAKDAIMKKLSDTNATDAGHR